MSRRGKKRDSPDAGFGEDDDFEATPGSPDGDEGAPPPKRRRAAASAALHHPPHSRALEWFYDLIDSPDYSCVSWRGTQGHFAINDAQTLLDEFKNMRNKPDYKLNTVLHNFFRPYNFQEINGEKKIKNGNVYISLDIESQGTSGMELSVFRPGNRDKLANVMHRGTGLPQRRYFVNGTTVAAPASLQAPPPAIGEATPIVNGTQLEIPGDESDGKSAAGQLASAITTMIAEAPTFYPLPRTSEALGEAKLTEEERQTVDELLLTTFRQWMSTRPRKGLKTAMGGEEDEDNSITEGEKTTPPPSFIPPAAPPAVSVQVLPSRAHQNAFASALPPTTMPRTSPVTTIPSSPPVLPQTSRIVPQIIHPAPMAVKQEQIQTIGVPPQNTFLYQSNALGASALYAMNNSIGPASNSPATGSAQFYPKPLSQTSDLPSHGLGLSSSNILFGDQMHLANPLNSSSSNLPS